MNARRPFRVGLKGKFKCPFCNSRARTDKDLVFHILCHHGKLPKKLKLKGRRGVKEWMLEGSKYE
ncbi:hypothetical protein A3K34_02795 [candidate division WWE3 bacterium RIFOXYC1_FULL_40_10]|uniref:C2H2-type domain-containing protein n=1 Tax=candidate division WWE3 bacterium RIFOXYA2_FULL_46_9 TaxID=1802636 RepID=A0A1F4W173_UNCKA|nr:MAG: hypothetical protein A3K58_02795 [candidate division WWE3 bacterium RIFOXYB1_FULL_40_22]OGC61774.1 MAG: hypothetical protein A3K37_02795 [candidate division WWE3 bacterium RIFOXYA1_FULL_40_11]OGC62793.1 MAG: hypothetical protein A2264_03955 [candidate division WWE3 bacterium RIFOXYA2_FULL_46_9]OGC65177.1 MAG: hypothetical protein A2326_02355 [candidate division WWE3 bacterium RIFOXYB2_FULL_41_6]OGC66157.1 MAG: hypothetical protein A3K34_02795 [candidate division WWE3 bacterium RIFOXYC1_